MSRTTMRQTRRHKAIILTLPPGLQKQLVKYGRNATTAPAGDLSGIAMVALTMAMLNRRFMENASHAFARYAKAEGFETGEHYKVIASLLEAR